MKNYDQTYDQTLSGRLGQKPNKNILDRWI